MYREVKSIIYSVFDVTGLTKITASITATFVSFSVTDIAQLIAICLGIISGVMAIRHYVVATKLNKVKLERLQNGDDQMMNVEETS